MQKHEDQMAPVNEKEDQTAKEKAMENSENVMKFYEGEINMILIDLKVLSSMIQCIGNPLLDVLVQTKINKLDQLAETQEKYNTAFNCLKQMKLKELEESRC